MSKLFNIKPGIYVVPGFPKKVDTREEITDEEALKLYTDTRFPFITPNEAAVDSLKRLKLGVKGIAKLVAKASSLKELELLSNLTDSKSLLGIIETAKMKFND